MMILKIKKFNVVFTPELIDKNYWFKQKQMLQQSNALVSEVKHQFQSNIKSDFKNQFSLPKEVVNLQIKSDKLN